MLKEKSTQQLLDMWEACRECQNVMGRFSQSYLVKEEGLIYQNYWSKRDDVSLGLNHGWYSGKEAVKGYYDALIEKNILCSRLIKSLFPDYLGDKSEEECLGVGLLGYKPVDTCVVEVAGDLKTAKGLWTVRGSYVDLKSYGMVSYFEFSYLAVDFIQEDGQWKIWHLQNLYDVDHPTGQGWSEEFVPYEEVPQLVELKDFKLPKPNVPMVLRELYHPMRAFSPTPTPPVPYETFSETFSYGI